MSLTPWLCFQTIQPDRFTEEQQKQMRWTSSLCLELMIYADNSVTGCGGVSILCHHETYSNCLQSEVSSDMFKTDCFWRVFEDPSMI